MTDEEIDRILREHLVRQGKLIPTTVREVMIAEEAMKNEPPTELPERLRDPYELMRRHPEVFGPVDCSICGRPLQMGECPNVNHRRRR